MSMFPSNSCRLCIHICHDDHHRLYDEDGRRNDDVYALTEKYFAPLLLTLECSDINAVICGECWRHISEFHTFQQSVLRAQKMSKRTEAVVKLEVEEGAGEFTAVQSESSSSNVQCQATEDLTDRVHCHEPEAVVKSEVDLMEYVHCGDYASRDNEVVTKKNEECEQSEDPDEQWEERDNLDDGKFDSDDDDEARDSDSAWSGGSVGSEPRVRTRQGKPKMEQESHEANSTITLDGNSFEITIKQEANTSELDSDSSSGDELYTSDARRANLEEGMEPDTDDDLLTELEAESKCKRPKRLDYRKKLKPPKTVQEYDDLIAQWKSSLQCVACSESCTSFSLLQEHFERQHPREKCHISCCQLQFYHRYELEKHIRFHTEPQAPKCEQCYTCFTSKSNLQEHLKRMHSGKPEADPNPNRIKNKSDRDSPKVVAHACEECGKAYKTLSNLRRHQREVHSEMGFIKCTICDKFYGNPRSFREHMNSHAEKPKHTCPFCQKPFVHGTDLYGHLTKVHPQEWTEKKEEKAKLKRLKEKRIYKCNICEKVYQRSNNLLEHMAKHERKVLYTCSYCSKTFNYSTSFKCHLNKVHAVKLEQNVEKAVSCTFCPMTFTNRAALYEHLRAEHMETTKAKGKPKKIHKCNICEKVFQRLHTLREHQARHEGKALYSCTYCSRTFTYRTRLNEHLKKEHVVEGQKKD